MSETFSSIFDRVLGERGLDTLPTVTTRREATWLARASLVSRYGEPTDELHERGLALLVEQEVARGGAQRHEERIESMRSRLDAVTSAWADVMTEWQGVRPEDRDLPIVSVILGLVALRGQGGSGDTGGIGGASQLPIIPIRHRAGSGGAWVSALREAIARICLDRGCSTLDLVYEAGDLSILVDEEPVELWYGIIHPAVWRLLGAPSDPDITGAALPVQVRVPDHGSALAGALGAPGNHPYEIAVACDLGRRDLIHSLDGAATSDEEVAHSAAHAAISSAGADHERE